MDPLTPETKAMDIPSLLTGGGGVAALGIVMRYGSRIFRNRTIDLRTDKTRMWDRIKELEQARDKDRIEFQKARDIDRLEFLKSRDIDRLEFLTKLEALNKRIEFLEHEKLELIRDIAAKQAELVLLKRDYYDAGEQIKAYEEELDKLKARRSVTGTQEA